MQRQDLTISCFCLLQMSCSRCVKSQSQQTAFGLRLRMTLAEKSGVIVKWALLFAMAYICYGLISCCGFSAFTGMGRLKTWLSCEIATGLALRFHWLRQTHMLKRGRASRHACLMRHWLPNPGRLLHRSRTWPGMWHFSTRQLPGASVRMGTACPGYGHQLWGHGNPTRR